MFKFLRDRFLALGREEDGAALMLTLAFFMFLYLLFIGVWAVGTNVRTRIHLQNACDAAAYSAAVVQADTLSRIATLNRAMSWTYAQMTKRQMDYIVGKWLQETCTHYDADESAARAYARNDRLACMRHKNRWGIGTIELCNSNSGGRNVRTRALIDSAILGFPGADSTFYKSQCRLQRSFRNLEIQIDADQSNIRLMNQIESSLQLDLPDKARTNAIEVLMANLGPDFDSRFDYDLRKIVDVTNDYFTVMRPSDELRFLSFSDTNITVRVASNPSYTGNNYFGRGASTWFTRRGEASRSGFHRDFVRGVLRANWTWWAEQWNCVLGCRKVFWSPSCTHLHDGVRCHCTPYYDAINRRRVNKARCDADNNAIYKPKTTQYYTGETVYPQILTEDYFWVRNGRYKGENRGTITVGISVKNRNPWAWIGEVAGGNVRQGIYSAFAPFVQRTVCLASAKAGYLYLGEDGPDYRIDWKTVNENGNPVNWYDKEQSWNLCQSDWDAVMVPVSMAKTAAVDGAWVTWNGRTWINGSMKTFLSDFVSSLTEGGNFRAGGTATMKSRFDRSTDEANWDQYLDLTRGPNHYVDQGALVRARWQIGNPGGAINWNALQRRIWH